MAFASLEQVANVLNMTPQMVNRHVKQNGMPRISRGEYDLVKCVHWYIDYNDRQIREAHRGTETESQARVRLVVASANLREVEFMQACGDLIEVDVAQDLWQRVAVSFRNKLLLIPTKLAPQVITCKEPGEAQALMEADIQEALHELSNCSIDTSRVRRPEHFGKIGRKPGRPAAKVKGK